MKLTLLMLIAVLAGCVVPFQSIVNGRLGVLTEKPLLAAFVSFSGGTLVLGILLLISSKGIPTIPANITMPWYLFTGGLLGAAFVTAVLSLVPKLGTAKVLAAAIVGQLMMSVIVDHYGLLNIPRNPVSAARVVGCLLLVVGTILISNAK